MSQNNKSKRKKIATLCTLQKYKCAYCSYPIIPHWMIDGTKHMHHTKPPSGWDWATFDHKTPIAVGGNNTIDNAVAACPMCNIVKGSLRYERFVKRIRTDNLYRHKIHRLRVRRLEKLGWLDTSDKVVTLNTFKVGGSCG